MTATEWLVRYLELAGSQRVGGAWQCPSHHDDSPSLSITEGTDGRVLIHCFGACSPAEVMTALGLSMSLLFKPHLWNPEEVYSLARPRCDFPPVRYGSSQRKFVGPAVGVDHHYYTPHARLTRHRFADGSKKCRWERLGPDGWWHFADGLDTSTLPLYNEREVVAARCMDEWVVLCESESSVDALTSSGIYATTWAGGAGNPQIEAMIRALKGANVVLIPDNDPAGLRCADKIRQGLKPLCNNWLEILGDPGQDARDLLESGEISLDRMFSLPRS